MTNFKGDYITRDDVKIAKNYLSELEFQALEQNPMTMQDWIDALDNQMVSHKRKVLQDSGKISHKQAIEKVEGVSIMAKRRMVRTILLKTQ